MLCLGVKFLDTCKNSITFPFIIEYFNKKTRCKYNNMVIIQSYGTRTSFIAKKISN